MPPAQSHLGPDARQAHHPGGHAGRVTSRPSTGKQLIEPRSSGCLAAPGQLQRHRSARSTQHRVSKIPNDEEQLTAAIIELARQLGLYDYRRIMALLQRAAGL